MTKPEHVKHWWGCLAEGYSVPVCEIDLRPGGAWRFVNRHPKGEAAFHGEYREIAPPSRLVFTEIFEQFPDTVSVVTAEFSEEGGKTRLTTTVHYPSLEVRDMVMASGMAKGAASATIALRPWLRNYSGPSELPGDPVVSRVPWIPLRRSTPNG